MAYLTGCLLGKQFSSAANNIVSCLTGTELA